MLRDRAVKSNKELFDKLFKPLITMIFMKLGKFDAFFGLVEIRLNRKRLVFSLDELLKEFSVKLFKNEDHFLVSFKFDQFCRSGYKSFVLDKGIRFIIYEEKIVVSDKITKEIYFDKSTNMDYSSEEIEQVADLFYRSIVRTLESKMKAHR